LSSLEKILKHSLTAVQFVTSAAQAGVPLAKIKKQTGHMSDDMVARYIKKQDFFAANPLRSNTNGLVLVGQWRRATMALSN
jgi:hypothetical protein